MLFASWPVTDALERAASIRRTRLVGIGTDDFCSVLILPGCPARLSDVCE